MAVKRVIKGALIVPMGMANAFLIEGDDGLTLIDAVTRIKRRPSFGRSARLAARQINSSI